MAGGGQGSRQKTGEEGPGWETMRGTEKRVFSYFDFKGSFESTCKEPSKGADERGKGGEGDAVDLERVHPDGFLRRVSEVKVKVPTTGTALLQVNRNNPLFSYLYFPHPFLKKEHN